MCTNVHIPIPINITNCVHLIFMFLLTKKLEHIKYIVPERLLAIAVERNKSLVIQPKTNYIKITLH
jgi:hypothetical protein